MVSFGHTMGKVFVQNPVPHFVHTGALELPQVAAADLLGGHGATVAGAPSHSHSATLAPTTMYGGFHRQTPTIAGEEEDPGGIKTKWSGLRSGRHHFHEAESVCSHQWH